MCMGGGSAATIEVPQTDAYDAQADLQIAAMQQTQNSTAMLKQGELNSALAAQQQVLTDARDFKIEQANDVRANAARMANLIGAPPPEKTAQAPVVGRDRDQSQGKPKGRNSLKVRKSKNTSQGKGAGLNTNLTTY
tara:strand:- start:307 stop:714 length:408 start_codon:yes stop_codon:yes gene_type:complete